MNNLSQTVPLQYDTGFSPYGAADWRAAFEDLHRNGFTGVEIAVAYPDRLDAEELCRHAGKNSLAITTISTGQVFGREGLFLASGESEIREGAMAVVRGHIDLSTRIGHPPVTIGLLRGRPEEGAAAAPLFAEAMLSLADYAEKRDVMLQIEPINKAETTLINNTAEMLSFLHGLGDPKSVGILFDSYHSNIEDGDTVAAIRAASGRITNFHIADSHRGLPGGGTIDFPAILAAALDTGYAGAFALETLCVPSREYILANQWQALNGAVQAAKQKRKNGGFQS